jgi:peptidoglycan/LPS O-acetylase OafA/YrhL
MPSKRFHSLDGMRGVCALIVAIFHCDLALNTGHLLNHGYLCVDAFFVLSGFVIGTVYEARLAQKLSVLDFARARARRLIPTHWLGTVAVAAAILGPYFAGTLHLPGFTAPSLLGAMVLGFLLIPDLAAPIDAAFPINTALWSLFDEWIVNMAYAKWLFRASLLKLTVLACTSWAIVCVFAYHNPYALCIGMRNSDLLPGLLRAVAGFFAGVIIFRLQVAGSLRKLPSIRPEIIYSLCFLASAVPTALILPTYDIIVISLMPLAIALLVRTDKPTPRVLLWLGFISYPLYVCQLAPVLLALAFLDKSPRHSVFLAIPILAAAIVLAWGISLLNSRASWSRHSSNQLPVTDVGSG